MTLGKASETPPRLRFPWTIRFSRSHFPLEPATAAGARFVSLAAEHAAMAAEHASRHDREGTFPLEVFDAMKDSGFLTATVPVSHGGMGVDSIHDLTLGLCELGRGDGSTSLAANMHLVFPLAIRWLEPVLAQAAPALADRLDGALSQLAAGSIAMGNATELGADLAHPLTEAMPAPDGWLLNGRKAFGTLSPIADWFVVSCRVRRPDGSFAAASALVRRGSAGQEIAGNWDGLGMRASGSHEIVYRDCFVPAELLISLDRDWGTTDELAQALAIIGNVGLLGTFLGIAEAARDDAVETLCARADSGPGERRETSVEQIVGEMDIELASMRAVVGRTTQLVDRFLYCAHMDSAAAEVIRDLGSQFQCAKALVNTRANAVVDRALLATGGGAYMSQHPLSRLSRDVRAGFFMQPYSVRDARAKVGELSLSDARSR